MLRVTFFNFATQNQRINQKRDRKKEKMKIFFKLFPELTKFCDNGTEDIEERIEEALFFAPYVSLGVQKQMLLNDIMEYRAEKGSFPNEAVVFYQE